MCFIQHKIHICNTVVKTNEVLSTAGTVKRKCQQDSIVWQHSVSSVREDFQSWCVSYNQTLLRAQEQAISVYCPSTQTLLYSLKICSNQYLPYPFKSIIHMIIINYDAAQYVGLKKTWFNTTQAMYYITYIYVFSLYSYCLGIHFQRYISQQPREMIYSS